MLTFDEAAVILDDLIEELPDGIYDELNGGVNLIEDCKTNEYGDHLMGMYHVSDGKDGSAALHRGFRISG